jgi:hypothetical protein
MNIINIKQLYFIKLTFFMASKDQQNLMTRRCASLLMGGGLKTGFRRPPLWYFSLSLSSFEIKKSSYNESINSFQKFICKQYYYFIFVSCPYIRISHSILNNELRFRTFLILDL